MENNSYYTWGLLLCSALIAVNKLFSKLMFHQPQLDDRPHGIITVC